MEETISVTNFKARCLDILKRLGQRKLEKVTGHPPRHLVAVITPPGREESIRAGSRIDEGYDDHS